MSCKARIELAGREWYTSGDQIEGTLRIDLSKDLDISEITVRFVAELFCIAIYDGHSTIDSTEVVHEQSLRLFPDPELGELMPHYTLKEGTYQYPFGFIVPGHQHGEVLYPSFESSSCNLRYYLRATVRRSSNFKLNPHAECQVAVRPCTDARLLRDPVRIETFEYITMVRKRDLIMRWNSTQAPVVNAYLGVRRSGLCAVTPGPELELILTKNEFLEDDLVLTNLEVILHRKDTYAPTRYSGDTASFKYPVINTAIKVPVKFVDGRADVSHVLETVRVPTKLLPSLITGFVDVKYRLFVTLSLQSGRAHRKLTLKPQVTILSELVHDHSADPTLHEQLPAYEGGHTTTQLGSTQQPPLSYGDVKVQPQQ